MKLPNLVLLPPWKPILHLVIQPPLSIFFAVTNDVLGLQTPRLKRLAEIVSAQAIAQQEKLEYSQDDINDLSDSEPNGA
jgi:hypothetical protein